MTDSEYKEYLKSDEWRSIAESRLKIDNYRCVCCGTAGTVKNPLEIHHLSYRYIGQEQSRIYEDLVTLCHVCHKAIHRTMERVTSPTGRRGWKDNNHVPQVHIFNVTGERLEHIESEV